MADERIDKIRKGPLRIIVKDKAGKPAPSATANAKLVKHAFAFGTCVSSAILFINEYAILLGGGGTTQQRDQYEKIIVENGGSLNGIGMQCHFDSLLTGPEDMLAILDRATPSTGFRFGLPNTTWTLMTR
jgi:GH35 family endo-1,4-beta-xylanase